MQVRRYRDVNEFLSAAATFLASREAEHNLLLGICSELAAERGPPDAVYFGSVEHDGHLLAAALRTPPFNLVLSEVDDPAALPLLAVDVVAFYGALPGLLGPAPEAATFAGLWQARTGQRPQVAMRQRIFRASSVTPPLGAPGHSRAAISADRDLLVEWVTVFHEEASPEPAPSGAEQMVDQLLRGPRSGFWLWEDEGPAALAGFGGPTPTGIRIGPVYTPPPRRRRGYASALVAALTQHLLLAEGRSWVFLFTDLANPTSNRIYARIGYRPVRDVVSYAFQPPAPDSNEIRQ